MKNYRIRIYGRIHNLGFRFYTMQAAVKRNVNGFVRNAGDGSIYIEAEGKDEDLQTFLEWCNRGPFFTRIEKVLVEEGEISNHSSFEIH